MKFSNSIAIIGIVISSMAVGLIPMVSAQAATSSGAVALYVASDETVFDAAIGALEDVLDGAGCEVVRLGNVTGAQGDIGIDVPNRFIQMTCASPVFDTRTGRALLDGLNGIGKQVALVEGRYVIDASQMAGQAGDPTKRAYLLKMSRYSNADPDARDRDLVMLAEKATGRADAYQTEAQIEVHRSAGLPTPDEAVVIYYDTSDAGDRFRNNNPDLIEAIGKFNKEHLTDFVYYVIQPTK